MSYAAACACPSSCSRGFEKNPLATLRAPGNGLLVNKTICMTITVHRLSTEGWVVFTRRTAVVNPADAVGQHSPCLC